ncbi:MAG: 4-hydroxy-3-methylbut-2-enyl diphosphate reductase [Erysipelotrichaceae bacterium]
MKVIKITPRGYCLGVIKALNIVKETINNYPQERIYLLGMIVHNQLIHQALKDRITLLDNSKSKNEWLKEIKTGVVIISAHGVAPDIIKQAKNKGLIVVEATCKYVTQSHNLAQEYLKQDYQIIYIGQKNHPEAEGVIGIDHKNIHLVSNKNDIPSNITKPLMVLTQTTLNYQTTKALFNHIKKIYPSAIIMDEICQATSSRQQAIIDLEPVDILYVVGDKNSNNANKLVEIAQNKAIKEVYLIQSVKDITLTASDSFKTVAITSAASTPTLLTKQVIDYLSDFPNSKKQPLNLDELI